MGRRWMIAAALLVSLAACDQHQHRLGQPLPVPAPMAIAVLHNAQGADIGRATAQDVQGGLRVTLEAHGLSQGDHGAHIHDVGRCDPPDFASAGGHWNPPGAHHGTLNSAGPHMGDLPNLAIDSEGRGSLAVTIPGATIAGLLGGDGSAIVVHADRDDMMTDPAGNSGPRVACGVFATD